MNNTANSPCQKRRERQIFIDLGQRSYPVILSYSLEAGTSHQILQQQLAARPVVIVSNETVWPLYGDSVQQAINRAGPASLSVHVMPDGESHKTPAQWLSILDHLAENGMTRDGVLVALGGGVICDMTGFAAACWMRGITFIQVPTTLLAQVDASVGGKTGINHARGKNLIGAFHQPAAVLINTEWLATLDEREFRSGLAEAVKYGFIQSAEFVDWVNRNSQRLLARDTEALDELVSRCCRFKAEVVRQDETEQGSRALLNLGHTFGHAIENLGQYRDFLHGEAVAIGMVMAAALSEQLGMAASGLRRRVESTLSDLGLPVGLSTVENSLYTPQAIVERMRLDKKVSQGKHRLILLEDIGQAVIAEGIEETDLLHLLRTFSPSPV